MLPLLMFEVSRILSSSDIHLCECTQFQDVLIVHKTESNLKYAVVIVIVIISTFFQHLRLGLIKCYIKKHTHIYLYIFFILHNSNEKFSLLLSYLSNNILLPH